MFVSSPDAQEGVRHRVGTEPVASANRVDLEKGRELKIGMARWILRNDKDPEIEAFPPGLLPVRF
jgi:hypothetical protein